MARLTSHSDKSISKENWVLWFFRAFIHAGQGNREEALSALRTFIEGVPPGLAGQPVMGEVRRMLQEWESGEMPDTGRAASRNDLLSQARPRGVVHIVGFILLVIFILYLIIKK